MFNGTLYFSRLLLAEFHIEKYVFRSSIVLCLSGGCFGQLGIGDNDRIVKNRGYIDAGSVFSHIFTGNIIILLINY